jgi:replicative DNA helicase
MEQYKDNFFIVQMPAPRIDLVKNLVREQVILHQIEYVFFDYIFICPSLLGEFKGVSLRNDEILLMFSTALKELAVELNVCVFTSTQVNAQADSNTTIRNESSIAGSRAVINKADIGMVCARPTKEEIDFFASMGQPIPNLVTDIYKVRSGAWTQVRIWSSIDLGTLQKQDLYMTDARLEIIKDFERHFIYEIDWEGSNYNEILQKVNEIK